MSEKKFKVSIAAFLSWAEFKLVFALQWVAWIWEAYGVQSYSDEEKKVFENYGTAMMWAIRYLALEHGYEFDNLNVDRNTGAITWKSEEPNGPGNAFLMEKISKGGSLDFERTLEVAVDYARVKIRSLDVEPMVAALEKVRADLRLNRAELSPDQDEAMKETIDAAMGALGIERQSENPKPRYRIDPEEERYEH